MIPIEVLAGKIFHDATAVEAEYQVLKNDAIARLRNVGGQLELLDGDLPDGPAEAYPAGSLPAAGDSATEESSPPAAPVDPNAGPVPPAGSAAGGGDVTPLETLEADLEGIAAALKAAGIESVEQLAAALAAHGEPVAVPDPGTEGAPAGGDQSGEAPAATGGGDSSAGAPSTPQAAQDPAGAPAAPAAGDPATAPVTPPDGSIDASTTSPSSGVGDVG